MKKRNSDSEEHFGRGFGAFLRSLLRGIPWSERADGEDVLRREAPAGGVLRVHNANGRTCVHAEDREDVEVRARKMARAESTRARESFRRVVLATPLHRILPSHRAV